MRLLYNPAVLAHDTGRSHPENPRRFQHFPDLKETPLTLDGADFLHLVHPATYIGKVRAACARSLPLDADTETSPGSFAAATASVALTLMAAEHGDFALVRPPGHHAYAAEAHGFCLFNAVAVAAQHAVNAGKRVLILDFDGHLGDGTMDIFYQTDQVLFWSLHQFPAYPGNGAATETGRGKGQGFTFNCPLPPGSADDIMLHAIEALLPAAIAFQPDVVAVSAGFDAHHADPLLQLRASNRFYHQVGRRLAEVFPGKVFATLEGGYLPTALLHGVQNFLAGMNAEAAPFPEPATVSDKRVWEVHEVHLAAARKALKPFWKEL